jgi:ubiquinone/menaquinone biosynthesis C-methylase UbiE
MEQTIAMELIREGVQTSSGRWADLGAGAGTFTVALASLLKPGSSIVAMDTHTDAMKTIPLQRNHVNIEKVTGDFSGFELGVSTYDGIVIANALHFVSDQKSLFKKLKRTLRPDGRLVVVEYDTDTSSAWIPYPVTFESLCNLAVVAGFQSCVKLKEVKSAFGDWNIYSACIE